MKAGFKYSLNLKVFAIPEIMKKRNLLFVFAILLLLPFSCKQDLGLMEEEMPSNITEPSSDNRISLAEAIQGYEKELRGRVGVGVDGSADNVPIKTPLWDYAFDRRINGVANNVISVPLLYSKGDLGATLSGYRRLLAFKNKQNKLEYYILEVLGDKTYMAKNNYKINSADFTGRIHILNWDGECLYGMKVNQGKFAGYSYVTGFVAGPQRNGLVASNRVACFGFSACDMSNPMIRCSGCSSGSTGVGGAFEGSLSDGLMNLCSQRSCAYMLVYYNCNGYANDCYDPTMIPGASIYMPNPGPPPTAGLIDHFLGFGGSAPANGLPYDSYNDFLTYLIGNGVQVNNEEVERIIDRLSPGPFEEVSNDPNFLYEMAREYATLSLLYPTMNKFDRYYKAYQNVVTHRMQSLLDVLGLIPGGGEVADAINGGLYLMKGDATNASLSFAAMAPIGGQWATVGKWTKNALKCLGGSVFITTSGLIFRTHVIEGKVVHRLSHVFEHTVDDLTKPTHGVFAVGNQIIETIEEGWSKVQAIPQFRWSQTLQVGKSETIDGVTRELRIGEGGVTYETFKIDMGRKVGLEGGINGKGDALNKISVSVVKGTTEVITAFPAK